MIHVYPGMGATSAMYGAAWREGLDAVYHDWPEWRGETTIREWAWRLIDEHGIADGDVLVGSSLGGIVACEVAKLRALRLTVLIGSAVNRNEINGLIEMLSPFIDFAPIAFIKACAGKLPGDLTQMFAASDPLFVREISKAIFRWDGADAHCPMLRIHGRNDFVISMPESCDCVLDGGHLLAMTHAADCIRAIKAHLPA